jgi:pimeloyl-ACP methyl ester carboxylesterase
MTDGSSSYASRFYASTDGLPLHAREYGSPDDPGIPVVCLPGLTRNAADFDPLARVLAAGGAGKPRRVLSVDYRGRGRSGYDPNWRNYSLEIENADLLAVLSAARIERAIFIGTSRGGLHAMGLSATCPAVIEGVVLNDIGPVLDPAGIARIVSYVGKTPVPRSLAEAVAILKGRMADQFTALDEADWIACANATFVDADGALRSLYDANLMKAFAETVAITPLPTFWPFFEGLRERPILVVRGANSDLLSPETVSEMVARAETCAVHVVEGQGHAPLLNDAATIGRICSFTVEAETAARARTA